VAHRNCIYAKVAQLVEHSTENAGVVGSIPSLGTNEQTHKASSQLRSGLRLFILTRFFLVTAKLTAIVDYNLGIPCNLVQA
jgi:hypothetical protein